MMGRTRTNKIVVFAPSPGRLRDNGSAGERLRRKTDGNELVGSLINVRIERANGFSLYGTPLLE